MNELEIKEKLKGFLCDNLGVDGDILTYDIALFGEEIGLDSIDSIELISFIDDEFGVSMTGVAKENFYSIDTLTKYIVENK
jgi:acyl carrier protein